MNLINYEIFRQRKNFNPLRLFERNEKLTYEMFCNFFESRLVIPPDIKYFLRVKEEFEKNKVTCEHVQLTKDHTTEVAEVNEPIPEATTEKETISESSEEHIEKELPTKTPSKRRKSRRKNNVEN